jgi:endonuclease YncB( thermonuclease family)
MTQWHEDFLIWQRRLGLVFLTLALLLAAALANAALADAGRLAFVMKDGALRIGQRTVHLHGIHIPDTGRSCDTTMRPSRCASRAALALDRKIQGMVYCEPVSRNRDRSINAVCRVDPMGASNNEREDLAAYLLRQGWAAARPDAPFEYAVMERIARSRGVGIWGFQADSVTVH